MKQAVGDAEKLSRPKITRRHIAIAAAVLVAIAVIVGICLWLQRDSPQQKTAFQTARDKANDAMNVGDYDASLKTLQEAESNAQSKQQQVELQAELSAAAASAGDIEQAITYLQKRHDLDTDTIKQDAYLMGSYYERLDNIPQAIAQYEIALAYKKSIDPKDSNGDIASLQAQMAALKGQQ